MKIGDKVKLNEEYYSEGSLYFGKSLRYKANFAKKITNISKQMTDSNGNKLPRVITLEGKDRAGNLIQFGECFLTLTN